MPIRLAIAGAAGRMGRRIVALAHADARFAIAAALEQAASPDAERDAGVLAGIGEIGLPVGDAAPGDFDVLLDFSSPAGTRQWLGHCVERRRAMLIGTTGLDAALHGAIAQASKSIAVLPSVNTSVGVNVVLAAVERLARELGSDFDVEIVEAHHRFKVDAPGGTALALKDAVVRGRAGEPPAVVHGRSGSHVPRTAGEIGMHSIRGGDVIGEHEVRFISQGETVAVRHAAHSRDTFARGALRAAAWLAGRPAGLYGIADVVRGEA
ncbi:MAG: 4-hydroxy-tetrahydrodipicolinate reductase [Phycisphaerae bacterium]